MLKKQIKPGLVLISTILFFTIQASELSYELLGFGTARPFDIPPLGISSSSSSASVASAQRKRALDNYLTKSLFMPANSNQPQTQDILQGLIQFILLQTYQEFTPGTPLRSIFLVSYMLFFRDYILSQPGATLQEQVANALTKLDQDFRENLNKQEESSNPQVQDTFTILLYALYNLPKLLKALSQRQDQDATNLFTALEEELEKWWGSRSANNYH